MKLWFTANKNIFKRWRHHWIWYFEPNDVLIKNWWRHQIFQIWISKQITLLNIKLLWKDELIIMCVYKVMQVLNLSHFIRKRPLYQKWWRHSRCCSQAKFEKLFFSKSYLKLRKTQRVSTVKYMQFGFCM